MIRFRSIASIAVCLTVCGFTACSGDSTPAPAPAPSAPPAPSTHWRVLAPLADGPRQEVGVATLAGEIYVIGGFDESNAAVADVEAYNPTTNTWRRVAPLPMALHHPNVAAARGRIYVVGALTTGFAATGVVYEYDPGANAWVARASMPSGTERGAAATASIGDQIYVAGGARGVTVNDFSVYDSTTNTWESLPALPTAREHFFAVTSGTRIITIGGRAGLLLAQVEIFDTATTSGPPAPRYPRRVAVTWVQSSVAACMCWAAKATRLPAATACLPCTRYTTSRTTLGLPPNRCARHATVRRP